MRFGRTLQSSIYAPWKPNYIDYAKLKKLLRENESSDIDAQAWTEEEESRYVEELVNVQLEKVNAFQADTSKRLREQTSGCEGRMNRLVSSSDAEDTGQGPGKQSSQDEGDVLRSTLVKLDEITKEVNELEKYSRINFTGFLKAAKKHDRRRGSKYRVRPLLQVRLAALPFNSEDYSPLLYRADMLHHQAFRNVFVFWVHPENILEVKTYILRRLPVLVYNPQTSKIIESGQSDPSITSLYFDNSQFALYDNKVSRGPGASSLRLRWFGHLGEKPEIFFEKKTVDGNGDSEETRFPIKEKYVKSFITGEYKLEKTVKKLRERQGSDDDDVTQLKNSIEDIQSFIKDNDLQPMLRANYTRTAFQIPGDDRVRISLDTDMAFIREDSLDSDRPCRNPEEWHRKEIDEAEMEFPFSAIRQGEISRFPFALLEIRVRDGATKRTNEWVEDLMSSHLVKEAPKFSKFVHGIAQLFEDYVNSFPFWLGDIETDIRRDPEAAFQQEQEKKAKKAEDEQTVGSFLGGKSTSPFTAAVGSPVGKSGAASAKRHSSVETNPEDLDSDRESAQSGEHTLARAGGMRSFLPSFSSSKYARAHRRGSVRLPPGVREPGPLIKDAGPVRVEPKVWLANQRTFVKWQHIAVLLGSLSLGLYNAAGESNNVARVLAVVYTLVAAFAGAWGWWQYVVRSRMIRERSGKDFDNIIGPIIVCVGLVVALCLNFGFKYSTAATKSDRIGLVNQVSGGFGAGIDTLELINMDAIRQDL
ncbi:Phosphate metabolism transcription protein [Lobaria immixta]|nr:Phosphate metabolism transcription protein [Lobaria immixta]